MVNSQTQTDFVKDPAQNQDMITLENGLNYHELARSYAVVVPFYEEKVTIPPIFIGLYQTAFIIWLDFSLSLLAD